MEVSNQWCREECGCFDDSGISYCPCTSRMFRRGGEQTCRTHNDNGNDNKDDNNDINNDNNDNDDNIDDNVDDDGGVGCCTNGHL
mmetsp:Transcript_69427/g.132466  ORF Transcript_69427/g.132466 Transcript_69427/m.132466 type:complete len:85 (+) Transcript_69427:178-432(+)